MRISYEVVGPRFAPRYIIWNSQEEFWTGTEWSKDSKKALIYSDRSTLSIDYNMLQAKQHESKPSYEFKTEVTVVVRSEKPVTEQQIQEYLDKAFGMSLKDKEFGHGPTPGSFTEVTIEWDKLKKNKKNPADK
jgi:uncharacterized protein YgbK (DUF1537 family)